MVLKFELKFDKKKEFPDWYAKVIALAELAEYYELKGCFIMRPRSMWMWREIKTYFTNEIEKLNVQEYYFPMLVSKSKIEAEKEHLESFDPELVWITKCGNKTLDEAIALRPTSETVIYSYFSKWITTYRDLPLKLNQWCNIIRWEVKSPTPFIRAREFLWQEGHTAYYKKEEAEKEVLQILNIYTKVYSDLLAIPVIQGKKSKLETFGGADYTLTLEAFIPVTGKGIQAATSHHLGQNFAKIFDITVDDDLAPGSSSYVYQNCWGLTTRSIGIAIMIHSDNRGFVCPPKIALKQIVIIPCGIDKKKSNADIDNLINYAKAILATLVDSGLRAFVDDRTRISVGTKFNEAEIQGIPFRIHVGFTELSASTLMIVRRHNFSRSVIPFNKETLGGSIKKEIENMHNELLLKAKNDMEAQTSVVTTLEDMVEKLNMKHQVLVPWCNKTECEEEIGDKTSLKNNGDTILQGAKSLCIPLEGNSVEGLKCINCSESAQVQCLFGRSY